MEFRRYLYLIWKWAWLIVLGTVLAGGTALLTSRNMLPVYQASATLRINLSGSESMDKYSALLTSQRLAQTYAQLLEKEQILEGVITRLGLDMATKDLAKAVEIQSVRDTDLIEITVKHSDPAVAQAIANEIPEVFIELEQSLQGSRYGALKASLAAEMEEAEAEIQHLQEAIAEKQADGAADGDPQLARLENDLAQVRSSYDALLGSYENIRLAEVQAGNNIILAVPARLPVEPVGPRVLLNTALAAITGAMIAAGAIFLIEYLDDTIKSPEDVDETLHLTTLGGIGRISGEKLSEKLVALDHPKSLVAEAYRVLRTNLQFSTLDKPLQTMLVTSPSPTEGKSTTVANLGVVMAQAGKSVIMVDADLRRPILHRIFGVENRTGLTNVLLNEGELDDHLKPVGSEVENLYLLTTGPLPPNPSELLGSQRMAVLIEQLKEKADLILFDSPPSLAVADASVLGTQTDGVLVVADAGRTRRSIAKRGIEGLRQVGANPVGVVLNRLGTGRGGYYYYYYYYHHYDHYYSDGHKPRRRRGLRRLFPWRPGRSRRRDRDSAQDQQEPSGPMGR